MFKKISGYINEVGQELSKVSWPTREQLYGATIVVLVVCLVMSLFVFGIDYVLTQVLSVIFPKG